MKDFLARLLSTLLHPLLTPTYSIITIWYGPFLKMKNLTGIENINAVIGWVFLFSTIIPITLLVILKSFHIISSVTLNDRKDRKYPLIGAMASNLGLAYVFEYLGYGALLKMIAVASAFVILISWFITFWWKISIHMASLGGYLAILIWGCLSAGRPVLIAFLITLMLATLLGWARVERKAHSPAQVVAGLLLGFLLISAFVAPMVI